MAGEVTAERAEIVLRSGRFDHVKVGDARRIIDGKADLSTPPITALSFWDRTVDRRGNSSSNFFFDSHLNFDDALADAREHWPHIFERFTFEVNQGAEAA